MQIPAITIAVSLNQNSRPEIPIDHAPAGRQATVAALTGSDGLADLTSPLSLGRKLSQVFQGSRGRGKSTGRFKQLP